ncbi:uncharacterized protein SCHCODRAFT_02241737 [Schizophyllum commune H4-8]|uniref:uncharacterized protein n=1 Tax=Schizophyllum commune (strain H4-8 / FGSC 9210) TaxID=578458 RepID=UPI00215F6ABF|nr:uncharacterized protein SCHCODRAFT_02241737 [Schizophyllum commune H4-8]KAI5895876.1 hypothetical protein SCHCODRAFT_02241737 [Schizophyllum commune H4-8]
MNTLARTVDNTMPLASKGSQRRLRLTASAGVPPSPTTPLQATQASSATRPRSAIRPSHQMRLPTSATRSL